MTEILPVKVHQVSINQTILHTIYPGHPYCNEKWIKIIKDIGDKMDRSTNIKGGMTDYNDLRDNPEFQPLKDFAISISEEHPYHSPTTLDTKVDNMWGAMYKKGDHTVPHWHNPYNFSFVYFLKSDENSQPLCFTDSSDKFYIPPIEGSFVLFPAYLFHHVPHQTNDTDRIVIAGNLTTKEKKK